MCAWSASTILQEAGVPVGRHALVDNMYDELLEMGAQPTKNPTPGDVAFVPQGFDTGADLVTASPWANHIRTAAHHTGLDPRLIEAVMYAESNGDPEAQSHAGAQGLMQLMPGTARQMGVKNSFDPMQNVMAGSKFLAFLARKYDGRISSALTAYNWGPGNVDQHGVKNAPAETRKYLKKVLDRVRQTGSGGKRFNHVMLVGHDARKGLGLYGEPGGSNGNPPWRRQWGDKDLQNVRYLSLPHIAPKTQYDTVKESLRWPEHPHGTSTIDGDVVINQLSTRMKAIRAQRQEFADIDLSEHYEGLSNRLINVFRDLKIKTAISELVDTPFWERLK